MSTEAERKPRLGLAAELLIAGGVVVTFLLVEFALVIGAFHSLRHAAASADRSEQTISAATRLEKLVLDLETGQRGYLVSGRPGFLQPWRDAQVTLPAATARLTMLAAAGAAADRVRAQRIVELIGRFVRRWSIPVVRLAQQNLAAARREAATGGGKRRVDEIRRAMEGLLSSERLQAAREQRRVARAERYGVLVGTTGIAGAFVIFVGIVGYFLRTAIVPLRRIAATTDRIRGGELAARAPEEGAGEVGELARGLNAMAASLERTQRDTEAQNVDLERLANLLRAVLDSTVDGILLTDRAGNVQLANRPMIRFAQELGMRLEGTVDERLLSIADRIVDVERYRVTVARLQAEPEQSTLDEFEVADPYRVFQGFTSPVRDDRRHFVGRIWTMREVTRERELDRLKEDFVATVSHELRTPLTSMMGFLEMLREGEAGRLNEEQDRFLAIVYRSSERLQRLVGDLLFVARLDANGLALEFGEAQLDEVVREAVESVSALARSREIELDASLDPIPPLRADRDRLLQLAGNLLSNALKFTPAGGRVSARTFVDEEVAVLEVADTGIGIPASEQERLFERFFRSATATAQAIPGTGLGLVITKAIAEGHGGSISVSSVEGSGATFRVELPLAFVPA